MKTQTTVHNEIVVSRENFFGAMMFVVYVNNVAQTELNTPAEVITWLEFNWPVGTQVHWRIKP